MYPLLQKFLTQGNKYFSFVGSPRSIPLTKRQMESMIGYNMPQKLSVRDIHGLRYFPNMYILTLSSEIYFKRMKD